MKKTGLFFFFTFLLTTGIFAQEFYCKVQINTQQVQGFDRSVVSNLKTAMTDFMNNRKWSNYSFAPEERIECTLLFTVSQIISSDEFKGTFSIIMQRPVFNTSYRSPLLNMIDKNIRFKYTPSQAMNFSEGTYSDNLTSLLAFYSYMMLGIDFDSFALNGGTVFYQKAMSVVQSAQNSGYTGWQSFENEKNRYHFVEQYLNKAYEPLRTFLYQYHRQGLDVMSGNVFEGRKVILNSLSLLKDVYNKRPGLYDLQLLLDAKRSEIINIFSKATPAEKNAMINILSEVDAPNGTRYREVLRQR
ncbi:hypothetical protein MNBD_BACTEROID07-1952 [hydrothermal vent metagenome]|uniref:DUF4835 domain-containing protein n=1 Tax=hydrothermal vent metagenome TaxID=652676 RepID=A0A3B0UHF6_9ZZZZ